MKVKQVTVRALLFVIGLTCLLPARLLIAQQAQSKNDAAPEARSRLRTFTTKKFYDASHLASDKPGDLIRAQEFARLLLSAAK